MVKEGLFTVDLQRYAKKGSGIGNLLPYGAQLGNLKGARLPGVCKMDKTKLRKCSFTGDS
jgi:hypothetical protein